MTINPKARGEIFSGQFSSVEQTVSDSGEVSLRTQLGKVVASFYCRFSAPLPKRLNERDELFSRTLFSNACYGVRARVANFAALVKHAKPMKVRG